ncbi:MAG: hypothetical protein Q9160_002977 [Pyrenula sp. 1 TL-2023]
MPELQDSQGNLPCTFDHEKQLYVARQNGQGSGGSETTIEWNEPEIEHDAIVQTEQFKAALEEFKKRSRNATVRHFDVEGAHDWRDVLKVVNKARDDYHSTENVSGKLRDFFHRIGDRGEAFMPFLKLLPDGNYKTLCGGLELILGAVLRNKDIRERISELLLEIPDTLLDSKLYGDLYDTKRLKGLAQHLYISLLVSLEDVVRWYTQSRPRKVLKGLAKGPTYEESLVKGIESVRMARKAIIEEAQRCLHGRLKNIEDEVCHTNLMMRQYGPDMLNGFKGIMDDVVLLAKWQNLQMEEISKLRRQLEAVQFHTVEVRSPQRQRTLPPPSLYSRNALIKELRLDINGDSTASDIKQILNVGNAEAYKYQDRARLLSEDTRFREWLTSASSVALLVQGNQELERISPLSFMAAMLLGSLSQVPGALVLSFFCGMHTYVAEDKVSCPAAGPVAAVRDMLAQLLSLKTRADSSGSLGEELLGLHFLDTPTVNNMQKGRIRPLLKTLATLIESLRSRFTAIFILIDGIEYYESERDYSKDTLRLLKALLELLHVGNFPSGDETEYQTPTAKQPTANGFIKVLLTTPAHSRLAETVTDEDERIYMPENVDGDEGGFGETTWNRGSGGRDIKTLRRSLKSRESNPKEESSGESDG